MKHIHRKLSLKRLPVILVVVHSAVVVAFFVPVFALVREMGEEGAIFWGILLTLDLPSSLVALLIDAQLAHWATGVLGATGYYVFGFGAMLAILGGLQYWLIGKGIVLLVHLWRRRGPVVSAGPSDKRSSQPD